MKGLYWIGLTTLLSQVLALFDPKSNSNVVYYWGQNSASVGSNDPTHAHWQKPLSEYCSNPEVDILVISFLHKFDQVRLISPIVEKIVWVLFQALN
ncbi:hypothetical protein BY458DRAFT_287332 [Sporodiniella umbellata]|nr:hypothetical protein BY458DRAFT_287332 [Sporodiniella umbellata]